MMDGWNMSGWNWGWMVVMMTIATLLVTLLAVTLMRNASQGPRSLPEEDPAHILALRLARGDIDEEEFQRRQTLLRTGHGSTNP